MYWIVCVCVGVLSRDETVDENRVEKKKAYLAPTTFNFNTFIFFGRGVALLLLVVHKNLLHDDGERAATLRIIFCNFGF